MSAGASTPLLNNDLELQNVKYSEESSALKEQVLENYKILFFTAISFLFFVIAEIIGAFASGSLSLLGDAGAMSVDVFTYICNYYAERIKLREGALSNRTKWVLEVYVPSFSIICLFCVTGYVTQEAIEEIRFPSNSGSVNVWFLYGFASLNLVIDIGSGYMFLRKGKKFAYTEHVIEENDPNFLNHVSQIKSEEPIMVPKKVVNINMLAAFSHLGADSMRTASVFIAAVIASCGVDSDLCDAWAAVVVSGTIVIMVIPLLSEIVKSAIKLRTEGQGQELLI